MSDADKLRDMINNVPDQSDGLASSIDQVQDQIDELNEEISAVQNGLCAIAEANAIDIIDGLIPENGYVEYGSTFGIIQWSPAGNLTDWEIFDEFDVSYYTYTPGDYPALDALVSDYAFGNDYLTRPLTDGASYGLIPYKENLEVAQSILLENKNKVDASPAIFEEYAS